MKKILTGLLLLICTLIYADVDTVYFDAHYANQQSFDSISLGDTITGIEKLGANIKIIINGDTLLLEGTTAGGIDSLKFNRGGSFAYSEGVLFYDTLTYTLNFYNEFFGFTHQLGQELVMIARNVTGVTIADAKPVYISGATGQLPEISLASALNKTTANVVGFTTIEFLNNAFGVVTIEGVLNDAPTAGYAPGVSIYLSMTPGEYDTVQVLWPYHNIHLGNNIYSHAVNGRIQLNIHHLDKRGPEGAIPYVNGGLELGFDSINFNYDTVNNALNVTALNVNNVPANKEWLGFALSDSSTELSTSNAYTINALYNLTIDSVKINLSKSPTGSVSEFDILLNEVSIFSTKPTIDAGERTTRTSATPYVLSTTSVSYDDIVTGRVTAIGATYGGAGAVIYIYYTRQ